MKIAAKIILGLLAFISFLTVTLLALAIFIWFKPEVVVNEKNIKYALTYAPEKMKTSWQTLNISFKSLGWSGKAVSLESKNLCFSWDPLLSTCASDLRLRFSFVVNNFSVKLTHIDEFLIHGDFLKVQLSKTSSENDKASFALPDLRLPAFKDLFPSQLDLKTLGFIEVIYKDISITPTAGEVMNSSVAFTQSEETTEQTAFNVEAKIGQGKDLGAHLKSRIEIFGQEKLQAQGHLSGFMKDNKIATDFSLTWESVLSLQIDPQVKIKRSSYRLPLSLSWNTQHMLLAAGPYTTNKIWSKGTIAAKDCTLQAQLHSSKGYPEKNELKCSVLVKPKKKINGLDVIETQVKIDVELSAPNKSNLRFLTRGVVTGENAFVVANIEGQGDLYFDTTKKEFMEKSSGNLKLFLKVPEFQVWKEIFETTLFAIPAPVHVLRGSIEVLAEAHLPKWKDQLTGNAQIKTNLAEKKQKLQTFTTVDFKLLGNILSPTGIDVDIAADLTDIRLEAPPMRLEAPPQILPDSRFILKSKEPVAQEPKKKFDVRWKVRAKTGGPLQVSSNLLPQPIPIELDIHARSEGKMDGKIVVQSFPFEIFRKKAQVDNITLTYHPNSPAAELGGKILYSNPEVDIRILFLGTTAQPRIEFESDPPLNRQQIMSVLLFNKSLNELTEEEVNSTASMSRALSDGAFGLFSLFFLSSTPIQSISYDPVERDYTARVRLDDSTTLSMGSNFSAGRQFTVRRRLGGPWSVRTELRQEENRPDVVLTLLEWLRRF